MEARTGGVEAPVLECMACVDTCYGGVPTRGKYSLEEASHVRGVLVDLSTQSTRSFGTRRDGVCFLILFHPRVSTLRHRTVHLCNYK